MTTRIERGQSWFRLPINWDMDENLIGLPEGTKMLFLKIVEFCHTIGSDGSLTGAQLAELSSRYTRGKQSVDRLLASGALCADSPLAAGSQSSGSPLAVRLHSANSPLTVRSQSVRIANAARWLPASNTPPPMKPGQNNNRRQKEDENVPRGGARVKKERETDREEGRTPSGSVRPSSAQAAPRGSGGAAQPAPRSVQKPAVPRAPMPGEEDQDEGDNLDEFEHLSGPEKAKAALARGMARSSVATGIPTQMHKTPFELHSLKEPADAVILSGDYQ